MPRIRNRLTVTHIPAAPRSSHPGSRDFDLSLELFIRDRKIMDARQSTIRWYTKHLQYFRNYLLDRQLPTAPAEITLDVVEDFILYQRDDRGNRPESINGKIRTLKAFFGFLKKKGILT